MTEPKIQVIASDSDAGGELVRRLRDASSRVIVAPPLASRSARELLRAASSAEACVVVADARAGIMPGGRREIILASLVGVPHLVVVLNGADSAAFDPARFAELEDELRRFADQLAFASVALVPAVLASGDNVIERSPALRWYEGSTLRDALLSLPVDSETARLRPLRLPVTRVEGAPGARRVFGTIASGEIGVGDTVRIQPSGRSSRVVSLGVDGTERERAGAAEAVSVELADAAEIVSGDLVAAADRPAEVADQFEATVIWLSDAPLFRGRSYELVLGSRSATATIGPLKYRLNVESLERAAASKLERDEIGVCTLKLDRPMPFDPHRDNPATGGFELLDVASGEPVGAGMLHFALRRAKNVHWQAVDVNKSARSSIKGQRPCVLWFTGLSGAGKSTIANLVDKRLHSMQRHTYLLDGDNVRHGLNKDLGFTAADRVENIRRIAEVAKLMVDAGLIVATAFISPFRAERSMARTLLAEGEFFEVFVDTPLAVAEERDPKGLYKKARRGELKNFTGIDSPYEAPERPDLRIDTTLTSPAEAADVVVAFLRKRGILEPS